MLVETGAVGLRWGWRRQIGSRLLPLFGAVSAVALRLVMLSPLEEMFDKVWTNFSLKLTFQNFNQIQANYRGLILCVDCHGDGPHLL